jgi:hypothetical protein
VTKLPTVREPDPNADPAALAFEALREEVALMRRAVAGLAAERAAIEIPDYSVTLGQLRQAALHTAKSLKTLDELPILNASVWDWARAIEHQAEPARRADRDELARIYAQLRDEASAMSARLSSARAADVQREWLLCAFGGGIVAGMLLWALGLEPVVRMIFK